MKIYVGNMPYAMTVEELKALFGQFGEVANANLAMDRETGRVRGFGFVEMPNADQANAAIQGINGTDQGGRKLVVNEARPREDRPHNGGFRGGDRGGFRGGDRGDRGGFRGGDRGDRGGDRGDRGF